MKKRIIIAGDSFSLGVGADFPQVFENVNELAPKIREAWMSDWKKASADIIQDGLLVRTTNKRDDQDIHQKYQELGEEYNRWRQSVYNTEYHLMLESKSIIPTPENTEPGLRHDRVDLVDYEHTWSNVLDGLLDDTEVVNLGRGGSSMASVVSSLSTYINSQQDINDYETLVFFQAPDPARKQVIATKTFDYIDDSGKEIKQNHYEKMLTHFKDYNVAAISKLKLFSDTERYDIEQHNFMYVEHDLYIGEWFQQIYNMQQICKANNFCMAWIPTGILIGQLQKNFLNQYPNVLGLDIRYDRCPKEIDEGFPSMVHKNLQLGIGNSSFDNADIYSGCHHFTGKVQKLFAMYMAKSLISNEEFWWQK